MGELERPGAYGMSCSKSMYADRTERVQAVQSLLESVEGVRRRKGRPVVRNVVVLGIRAAVTFCTTVARRVSVDPDCSTRLFLSSSNVSVAEETDLEPVVEFDEPVLI